MLKVLSMLAAAALLTVAQPAPERPIKERVQTYMDEWRAAATPGAAVGIVLRDGTALSVVTGVSDRATKRPATPVGLTWGHSGFFPGYQTGAV